MLKPNDFSLPSDERVHESAYTEALRTVHKRATQAQTLLKHPEAWLITIAADKLTLSCVALYHALLSKEELQSGDFSKLTTVLDETVADLRHTGDQTFLPAGLLVRSSLRFLTGVRSGPGSAQEDLDEAWEIAQRGPMKLHMADIHLYRARLFFREKEYPWDSAKADLEAAEKLINDCGYHRRDEELADAKRAILGI